MQQLMKVKVFMKLHLQIKKKCEPQQNVLLLRSFAMKINTASGLHKFMTYFVVQLFILITYRG